MSAAPPRLPFEALAAYVGPVYSPKTASPGYCSRVFAYTHRNGRRIDWLPLCPARAVAVALGDTPAWRRAAHRWALDGLTVRTADRVAELLCCTPWDIWGPAYAEFVCPDRELA